jgi:hypothetical protein
MVLLWRRSLASCLLAIEGHSGHGGLCGSDRQSVISYVHRRT